MAKVSAMQTGKGAVGAMTTGDNKGQKPPGAKPANAKAPAKKGKSAPVKK